MSYSDHAVEGYVKQEILLIVTISGLKQRVTS